MGHYLCGHETGLRAYWSFDEGEGQMLHDAVGQNDGQINGPVWVAGVELARPGCEPMGDVGGSVTGLRPALIACRNVTTGRRIVIQDHEISWNCETAGLEVTSGDVILINILGGAN